MKRLVHQNADLALPVVAILPVAQSMFVADDDGRVVSYHRMLLR